MKKQIGRKARLVWAFHDWYPNVEAGLWHDASALGIAVRRRRERGSPRWSLEGRALADGHFEFRGGEPPRAADWDGRCSRNR